MSRKTVKQGPQVRVVAHNKMITNFKEKLVGINPLLLWFDGLKTLQINLGDMCNQKCAHCHVRAGPRGQKIMSREVMLEVIDFLRKHSGLVVDVTGGCPELNPDFKFFVDNVYELNCRLMVRTNLTVFFEPGMNRIPNWYRDHKVVVVGSLPCYTEENVDKQRGQDVFEKSIKAIGLLNELGYGYDKQLQLNLVYNPGADFLPGPQQQLETDYKEKLNKKYGVRFNKLFTMTNAPIGRFKQYLKANGRLRQYLQLLAENFNPDTVESIMCRNLISVDYRGLLYNCDFNQALGLGIADSTECDAKIGQLENIISKPFEIITGQHCFCCTAGAGSSCVGSLVNKNKGT